MRAKFMDKLMYALEVFDLVNAETLMGEIHEAEWNGYVVTAGEARLLDRLSRCIDSYRRCSAAIES